MVEFIYFFSMKIGFGEVKNIVFAYVLKYVYLLLKSVVYFLLSVSEIFIGGPEYLGYIQCKTVNFYKIMAIITIV